jgi:pyruvate dehydrogenase E1 component
VPVNTQDPYAPEFSDNDPEETADWRESLDGLVAEKGPGRAREIMTNLLERSRELHLSVPQVPTTDYVNTIAPENEPDFPGNEALEREYRSYIRWNAAMLVHRAQRPGIEVGGHISSYASAASLYEVGFNHFFRGSDHPGGGDQVFFQGHASPGMYARAFLEGRLSADQLDGFRQEVSHPGGGLPSYPHPRLLPDFWQFPTVSMGIGPVNAISQASMNKYLTNRGIQDCSDQHVWAFLGDGELDEIESRGMLQVPANDGLDNLTFVVNCNLQRLDGPVRGNGKIIQELESYFRGAGWNVIKVIWGREWDDLLARDTDGALLNLMNVTPDGDFQTYKAEDGAYVRKHFFGRDERALKLVEDFTDDEVWGLRRGGHDYRKVYSAFKAAVEHKGRPTVILAHTIKGYGLGPHFEGRNATHQMKKMTLDDIKLFRDTMHIPISDRQLEEDPYLPPYYRPTDDSEAIQYIHERRRELGGYLPRRSTKHIDIKMPDEKSYSIASRGSGKQKAATTMVFVRMLKDIMRDKNMGPRFVPIIPDEARTFGMDAYFPKSKIYNPYGQNYTSVDRNLLLAYKEAKDGVLMHMGINEAGAASMFSALGTSYSVHGEPMVPIYIFYSMFGFQRTGDFLWAASDQMTRGFLIGATAGRTTLTGEGLQHADGHSLVLASTNPATLSYDPAYGYEIGHIFRSGVERMYGGEHPDPDVFYYMTVYNEPIVQPDEPDDVDIDGIVRGIHRVYASDASGPKAQILASGVAVPWSIEAAELLEKDWGVSADVWSVTSWSELRRDGLEAENEMFMTADGTRRTPYLTEKLKDASGPKVAVSDWESGVPDQIRQFVPGDYAVLGADGFGFSDTRQAARRFFGIDRECVVVKVLQRLAVAGEIDSDIPKRAHKKYQLDDVTKGSTGGGGGDA